VLRRIALFVLLLISAFSRQFSAATPQGFRISGVVVDSVSGAPIDRAEVTIAAVTNLDQPMTSLSSTTGQFLFTGLPQGKYRLTAKRHGYTQQGLDEHEGFMTAVAVGPKLDSEHIRFRLSRESVIAGNVSNEYGEPFRQAEVFLFQHKISSGLRTTNSVNGATTDDLGNYRFAHLAPGTYFVVAYAKPWYSAAASMAAASRNVRLAFEKGGEDLLSLDSVQTDGPRRFSESDTAPEPEAAPNPILDVVYPISFYSNAGTLDSATSLTLTPGATLSADFFLHPVPALHLLVKLPPRPFGLSPQGPQPEENSLAAGSDTTEDFEASLQIAGMDIGRLDARPSSSLPGFYEVLGVSPGELALLAGWQKQGQNFTQSKILQVSSESRIDMTPQGPLVSVSGTIVSYTPPAVASGDDAHPSPPLLNLSSPDGRNSFSSSINAKGEFSLFVPSGQYQVTLEGDSVKDIGSLESADASVSGHTVRLAAGTPVKLLVHLAEANCAVSGTALKNGQPIAGAMILLVPEDPSQNTTLFHRDQSDSDGTFTLGQVLPGRYTLLAIENGWDLEWSNLTVLFRYLPNGLLLVLKPGVSVSASPKVQ
jgi:hypothetical protein